MRCFRLLGLVLRLVYVSYIQVGNRARSKSWQKVPPMVSAAAASVSTSAAAWRDAATLSFPAACTLGVNRMLLGCARALWGGHELVAEKWNCWWTSCRILQLAADLQRPFSGKEGLNSILAPVLGSLILLRAEVQ